MTTSISALLERDAYLFRVDVNERTIAHRLGLHMEANFIGWDVDCEYNRDGHDPKEMIWGSGDDHEHGSRVFPDVIVHRRGTHENLLVVELKKSSNPVADYQDIRKLQAYCTELGYSHALFVRLAVGTNTAGIARAEFIYG
jgi:hypothetical protein